jgi:hypothetical protein
MPNEIWTFESIFTHFERRFADKETKDIERFQAQEKMTSVALAAADRAVLKAEAAVEKRFESVNEFRGTLEDQQRTFMQKAEAIAIIDSLKEKVAKLEEANLKAVSKGAGLHQGWLFLIGALGFVSLVLSLIERFK